MGAKGTATVDFGAFPGASDASVVVTGQAGIVSGSLVEAWLRPVDTADHTAEEHMVETLKVYAHSIVAATGFTITAFNTSQLNEPLSPQGAVGGTVRGGLTGATAGPLKGTSGEPSVGGMGTRIYGQWTVAWVWD